MNDELRHIPQPIREDDAGATDLCPRDVLRDIENPDMLVPPISLNQWMALTPPQLVKEHLHVDDAMIRALHK
ncbi:hypothetical protein C6W20_13460 [Bacillus sp. NMCN6]|nr:hypothetical protein C6W20_13460 [Bacillus sp. NMCN6]